MNKANIANKKTKLIKNRIEDIELIAIRNLHYNAPKHKITILLSIYQPSPVSKENVTLRLIEFHQYVAMELSTI